MNLNKPLFYDPILWPNNNPIDEPDRLMTHGEANAMRQSINRQLLQHNQEMARMKTEYETMERERKSQFDRMFDALAKRYDEAFRVKNPKASGAINWDRVCLEIGQMGVYNTKQPLDVDLKQLRNLRGNLAHNLKRRDIPQRVKIREVDGQVIAIYSHNVEY